MKRRRVEVMIETHRVWIVREPGHAAPGWCPECARTVRMMTADAAARLVCQSTRAIYRLVEERRLHYRETPMGALLVCLDSLLAGASAHRGSEALAALEQEKSGPLRDYGHET
ncbi:MAG TPA: hypothetical protein VGC89_21130 [Pyrinomonadaceae bacterium]|jgi:hypothetical protein